MNERGRQTWGWALGLSVVLTLVIGVASAKKPPPPPPPPPDPGDVGTVYVNIGNTIWSMDPDGANQEALPVVRVAASLEHRASRDLHGGERWFLQKRAEDPGLFDPIGTLRWEIYAVSDSGKSVLLFSEENVYIENAGSIGWATHDGVVDGLVSFAGIRYVEDPDSTTWPVGYSIGEAGIYVAPLDPDALATAGDALELEWSLLPIDFGVEPETNFRVGYDWAPDGTALVYWGVPGRGGIRVARQDDGWTLPPAIAWGSGARWSNDGTRLAFNLDGDICTMDPDGSNVTVVVPDPEDSARLTVHVAGPFWSPNDTHLVHMWWTRFTRKNAIPPYDNVEVQRVQLTEDGSNNPIHLIGYEGTSRSIVGWCE
ncbi:MAG: TolB family protein [Planctomycetota bacterium]|jgi:hypothetical protein